MKHLLHTLIMALMLLSVAGFCIAAEEEAPIKESPQHRPTDLSAPLITDQNEDEQKPDSVLDTAPSSWSNVKALWG